MAKKPLPTTVPAAQEELITSKERILELRTQYRDRHQRVLDKQTNLRVVLNTQFQNLLKATNDPEIVNAAIGVINAAFLECTTEMQAQEDSEPDKPIDLFPDRDLPELPGRRVPIEDLTNRGNNG